MHALASLPAPRAAVAAPDEWPASAPALCGTFDDMALTELLAFLAATAQSGVVRLVPGEAWLGLAGGTIGAGGTGGSIGAPVPTGGAVAGSGTRADVLDAVVEMLASVEAGFAFVPGEAPAVTFETSVHDPDLLAEAAERVEDWRVATETIASPATVVARCHELPAGVDQVVLSADQFRVLSALDAPRGVAELGAALGLTAWAVSCLAHLLVQAGVLVVVQP